MIYREKGGSQTTLFEYIDYCAIMDLQNSFPNQGFSDLPGTEMGMLELVLDHFALVFL
jgi:hypothetical protein